MKFSAAAVLTTLLVHHNFNGVNGVSIRGAASVVPLAMGNHPNEGAHEPLSRALLVDDFTSPLSCNNGVALQKCQMWSTRFGKISIFQNRVVVNCGECVEMDFQSPELTFLNGIDIHGRLVINSGPKLTISSTLIAVQGELVVNAPKLVDGTASVKFIMIGETDQSFQPIGENVMNCNGGGLCNAGKKAIVVAGGRIQAHGLPNATPAWVKLHDVSYVQDSNIFSGSCPYLVPPAGDAENRGNNTSPFHATHPTVLVSIGADPGNYFFRVRNRAQNCERCGLAWKVEPSCISEGTYLRFSANVRLPLGSTGGFLVLRPRLQVQYASGELFEGILANCPSTIGSEWIMCTGLFIVPAAFVGSKVSNLQVGLGGTAKVDFDVDNISLVADGNDPNVLIVNKAVQGKWGPGAEVLVTSHTNKWDGHQVRKIEDIRVHNDPNYVQLKLDSPIPRPTTLRDDRRFAVEVALLSRNIIFEGGPDSNPLHGGHFWIFHTPNVNQYIVGIEVKKFGQQGILGRYPIHFHFCGNSSGAIVSKNTVRDSNQRAIVIHGTDNVRVEENVVFNTKGHAIILEDGMEQGNKFIRNLGAATGAVDVVIPNNGFNGQETDALPATYWISNPSNTFIGNVAAGSENSGFWFELRLRGPKASSFPGLDPRSSPLGQFKDNIAHSNFDRGLRTYPNGFMPDEQANFIGFLSYRNKNKGLFFHQTDGVAILDSIFADNSIAIDLDQADNVTVQNVTIIGQTDDYQRIRDFQNAPSICGFEDELVGMEMHTFVLHPGKHGAIVRNTTFDGFRTGSCDKVAHVKLDDETRLGLFDWFTTFQQVQTNNETAVFDFCPAAEVGVQSYLIDRDGSFDEKGNTPGSVISTSLMTFVNKSGCQVHTTGCNAYCKSCFRTVRFATDPSGTDDFTLRLCRSTGSPCENISGKRDPNADQVSADNLRFFTAHLPKGSYNAVFVKGTGVQEVWPTFVVPMFADKLCLDAFDEKDILLKMPIVGQGQCSSLIRNGNAEGLEGWLHRSGGLRLTANAGIGRSNALDDRPAKSDRDTISQFLDTRCLSLLQNRYYEIRAQVKLVDKAGKRHDCHVDGRGCPDVRIVTSTRTLASVATLVPQVAQGDFQLLHGVLFVDQELAKSKMVEFVVRRNRGDFSLQLDDVAMTLRPAASPGLPICRQNLVENGGFSSGNATFWSGSTAKMSIVGKPGNFSLALGGGGYGRVFLRAGCFVAGERYEVLVQFRTFQNGQAFACDPFGAAGSIQCPSATLVAFRNGIFVGGQRIVQALDGHALIGGGSSSSHLYGVFTATAGHAGADRIFLQVDNLKSNLDYHVHSVSMQFLPRKCNTNVLVNSNMGLGITSFWKASVSGSAEWTTRGYNETDGAAGSPPPSGALRIRGRTSPGHGLRYNTVSYLDPGCLVPGAVWEVSAQIRLFHSITGEPASCNPVSTRTSIDACPSVLIQIRDAQMNIVLERFLRQYVQQSWNSNDWNGFRAEVTLPRVTTNPPWTQPSAGEKVTIQVINFPVGLDAVVDNFVVRQLV